MYEQIINYLIEICLRHKAVNNVRYRQRILTNAQNNNGYLQILFDTDAEFDLLISAPNTPFSLTLNVDCIGLREKDDDKETLKIQSMCLDTLMQIVTFIKRDDYFMGLIDVHDYSFLGLDNYTDDAACGYRMTLVLTVPDPVDICTLDDNFLEEPKVIDNTDKDIDLIDKNPPSEKDELILRPILIPHK